MTKTLCKDCKHLGGFNSVCNSPNAESDLVMGTTLYWAREARTNENLCGTDAKWFESNKPISTFQKIVKWLKGL